jgi:ABC-type bacteriocin/lantibiotic exporter with double-glycine peptidase domain
MLIKLKVPYFRQEKWFTCGPVCLRMIFAYFGIDVTEKALETICETTELGTIPTKISTGAANLGVEAIATKNADLEDLRRNLEDRIPVIVLIDPSYIYGGIAGFGHFVVVVGIENGEVIYHDPDVSEGKFLRSEMRKFLSAWNIFKRWMVV